MDGGSVYGLGVDFAVVPGDDGDAVLLGAGRGLCGACGKPICALAAGFTPGLQRFGRIGGRSAVYSFGAVLCAGFPHFAVLCSAGVWRASLVGRGGQIALGSGCQTGKLSVFRAVVGVSGSAFGAGNRHGGQSLWSDETGHSIFWPQLAFGRCVRFGNRPLYSFPRINV